MRKEDIVPLRDMVLVRSLTEEETETIKTSKIIIPEKLRERPSGWLGEVIAMGNETILHQDPEIKAHFIIGDKVVFHGYAGVSLPKCEDGSTVLLLTEKQILAVVKK